MSVTVSMDLSMENDNSSELLHRIMQKCENASMSY